MPEVPTPAAALMGDDANSAVVILREKNATQGVFHKLVANATIFRMPLLHVPYSTGEKQELLQQREVELLQSVQVIVAN